MCVGIPMQVVSIYGMRALCRGAAGDAEIDTLLVGDVRPGDWVLTHLGAAREVIVEARARQVQEALDALNAVMRGEAVQSRAAIDLAFADLISRPPELPPHLRGQLTGASSAPAAPQEDA